MPVTILVVNGSQLKACNYAITSDLYVSILIYKYIESIYNIKYIAVYY